MKKIFVSVALAVTLFACSNSTDENKKVNGVDTTVIGSDNPNPPAPADSLLGDTTGNVKKQ